MNLSVKTIKQLCTLSGNRCAFYDCPVPLVDDDSEAVVGEICHIRASRRSGPRYDPSQTEDDRDSFSNLILLCSMHHTIIDSDVAKYTVEYLQGMKAAHNPTANIEVQPIDAVRAERLLRKYDFQVSVNGPLTTGPIQAHTVTINGPRNSRPKIILPVDVVGGSSTHRRYMSHLIERYKEFASKQPGRVFRHAAIYGAIKNKFGATWEWVALTRFTEFATFVQKKIDGTWQGKINRSKGYPNYSSFEQYRDEHDVKA